jgi:hypothetical protein
MNRDWTPVELSPSAGFENDDRILLAPEFLTDKESPPDRAVLRLKGQKRGRVVALGRREGQGKAARASSTLLSRLPGAPRKTSESLAGEYARASWLDAVRYRRQALIGVLAAALTLAGTIASAIYDFLDVSPGWLPPVILGVVCASAIGAAAVDLCKLAAGSD